MRISSPYTVVHISQDAIRSNIRKVRGMLGGRSEMLAMVKTNAYGFGVEHVVPVMEEEGVGSFGVVNVAEGIALRELGVKGRIVVVGRPFASDLQAFEAFNLELSITDRDLVDDVIDAGLSLRVHLKIDTGMHRLGIAPDQIREVFDRLKSHSNFDIAALWTHLATADAEDFSFAIEQLDRFDAVVADLGGEIPTHVANSGAMVQIPRSVDGREFVREGRLLYGIPPTRAVARRVDLEQAMTLTSKVVRVDRVPAGESVSYGRRWFAERDTNVATIAAGYADGLPAELSNGGKVGIHGRTYPVVGRVCMDMILVDIGANDDPQNRILPDDDVVLFGKGELSVSNQADIIKVVVPYILTTGLTARVERVADH